MHIVRSAAYVDGPAASEREKLEGVLTMATTNTDIAKDMAKMISLNVNFLCSMVSRGAASHYNIYRFEHNPRKEATYGAIHNQIMVLRNMLLELDRLVKSIHNTY